LPFDCEFGCDVSGGTADLPERWQEANEHVYRFFQWWLGDAPRLK
jgi:hypothetical protein